MVNIVIMKDKKREDNILICPNPIAIAPTSQCQQGGLMPGEIHGVVESDDKTVFNANITQEEVTDILENSPIDNQRFEKDQFTKYFGQDKISWCGLFSQDGNCVSLAAIQHHHPFSGYLYISEIQTLKKGYGLQLLKKIVEQFRKVWLMANTSAGDSLIDYYRDTGLFEEIAIEDSIYGCPAYFFCTSQCDYVKLEGYCVAFYANDNGDQDEEEDEFVDESTIKKESSIDFPVSSGLCSEIWDEVEEGQFKIKGDIKQRALELVDKLLARYHVEAKGVNVVGSICSNQYTPDSDVDVHIQVDLPEDVTEKLNNIRKKEQDKLFEGQDLMVGQSKTHPLEFYFQSNIYGDMGSCGCYDLMNDEWLSGPQFVDMEFDPFEEYCQSFDEAVEFGHRVSNALFDVQKNLYKYNAILDHASNEEVYEDDNMMSLIGRRLEDVSEDLIECMRVVSELKDEMVKVRKRAGLKPSDEQEAEDMRTNKEWLSANSTFKFLQRMNVLDSCWNISDIYQEYVNGDVDVNSAIFELNSIEGKRWR